MADGSSEDASLRATFVRVQGVTPLLPETIIRQFLDCIGPVLDIRWHATHDSRVCVAQFGSEKEARTACLLSDIELGDGRLSIDLAPSVLVRSLYDRRPIVPMPQQRPMILPLPPPVLAVPVVAAHVVPVLGRPPLVMVPRVMSIVDAQRAEEIARTVHLGNVPSSASEAEIVRIFDGIGAPEYIKLAAETTNPTRYAFVQFKDSAVAQKAMGLNGTVTIEGYSISIRPAKNAITKPSKSRAAEVDSILRRVQAELSSKVQQSSTSVSSSSPPRSQNGHRKRSRSPRRRSSSPRARSPRRRSRDGDRDRHRHRSPRRDRERSPRREHSSRHSPRRHRERSRSRSRDRRR